MTEAQFQQQVIDLARLYGWLVAHFRPARVGDSWRTPVQADGAGFPDLVLVRGDRLIFAELKGERGALSTSQHVWIDRLREVAAAVEAHTGPLRHTIEVHVWRPSDFDLVEDRLRPAARAAA